MKTDKQENELRFSGQEKRGIADFAMMHGSTCVMLSLPKGREYITQKAAAIVRVITNEQNCRAWQALQQ